MLLVISIVPRCFVHPPIGVTISARCHSWDLPQIVHQGQQDDAEGDHALCYRPLGAGDHRHPGRLGQGPGEEVLEAEGVEVTGTKKGWKTDLKRFGWRTTLEEAESFQEMFQKKNI